MSFTVTSPLSSNLSFTTNTFSMRCWCNNAVISLAPASSPTVTSRSLVVITVATGSLNRVSNRRSRLVTIPTSCRPSTTGTPEMLLARVTCKTSPMVASGLTVRGSRITPASYFFTCDTSLAWRSGLMFLWMMPMPPWAAMAIARRASVTVSMAAEISGILSLMRRVRRVFRLTSRGKTWERAGTNNTSSNVRASSMTRMAHYSVVLAPKTNRSLAAARDGGAAPETRGETRAGAGA